MQARTMNKNLQLQLKTVRMHSKKKEREDIQNDCQIPWQLHFDSRLAMIS